MSDFNPSESNIADVHKYLKKNPDQLQSVLDAEKSGKNRPTLVSDLEEQLQAIPQAVESPAVEVSPSPAPTKAPSFHGKQYEVTPEGGYRVKK